MRNNKLAAFSLIELMVVMLISGITISLAYTSYSIMDQQFNRFRKSTQHSLQIAKFQSQLEYDVLKCNKIWKRENQLVLESGDQKVQYLVNDDGVIRIMPGQEEVYELELYTWEFKLDGLPIEEDGLIDEIFISSSEDDLVFHLSKQYSAYDLIYLEKEEDYGSRY